MHELSLVQSLLEIVAEYALRDKFTRVRSMRLSCGRLSCIDPEAFRFVFSVQAAGTKAAGAELLFDIRPAILYCLTCEREFPSGGLPLVCPSCGGQSVLLNGGTEELRLLELDVD